MKFIVGALVYGEFFETFSAKNAEDAKIKMFQKYGGKDIPICSTCLKNVEHLAVDDIMISTNYEVKEVGKNSYIVYAPVTGWINEPIEAENEQDARNKMERMYDCYFTLCPECASKFKELTVFNLRGEFIVEKCEIEKED